MNTKPLPSSPIVAIMGHIDHGKSTLLDYIRKTKVVDSEAGGITQHLSAYEINIPYQKTERSITFLDTPGHAAFSGMRERGAIACDIAVLVVSAEDGVKAQTIEALKTIRGAKVPFVVAINKIDRPEANIERTKQSLAEHEVLVEGYGGTIPWVAVSAKVGTGITELLDTILLIADLEDITSDPSAPVAGIIIESHLDTKRGIAATLVVKQGTLTQGQFVVAGDGITTTRIMEDFRGKTIASAGPGTPVQLVGFNSTPVVGSAVVVFDKKKDAEKYVESLPTEASTTQSSPRAEDTIVPLIIKADVFGTVEAIEREISRIEVEGLHLKIIMKGVGTIGEGDIRMAQSDKNTIILGFNVGLESRARELSESTGVTIELFDIIYKLTEWLAIELEKRRPRVETREVIATAKVLKEFSRTKDRSVIGCRILSGTLTQGTKVSVIRRDFTIATGTLIEIQQAKQKVKEIIEGECGLLVDCKHDIAAGDILEAFVMKKI